MIESQKTIFNFSCGPFRRFVITSLNKVRIKMMFHQSKYLQLIPLIISFQIMLCINHLLFNKIISSHRYKETVSFLNGQLAPLFQSAMIAAKKYKILLNSHLRTWLWHIKIFAGLKILLLGYRDILMHLKMFITLGLIHHFKCSSLFHHCTFRDYYPSFIGAHEIHISYFWIFFQDQDFFVCYLSTTISTLVLSSLGFEMCLMSLV